MWQQEIKYWLSVQFYQIKFGYILFFFFNYIKEQWNVKQNWFESETELNVTIKFNFNPKINAK